MIQVYIDGQRARVDGVDALTIRDELAVPLIGGVAIFDACLIGELRAVGYAVEEIISESANDRRYTDVPHTRDGYLFDWKEGKG